MSLRTISSVLAAPVDFDASRYENLQSARRHGALGRGRRIHHATQDWTLGAVELSIWTAPDGLDIDASSYQPQLIYILEQAGGRVRLMLDGREVDGVGPMHLVAGGAAVSLVCDQVRSAKVLFVRFDPTGLRQALAGVDPRMIFANRLALEDVAVGRLARLAASAAEEQDDHDAVYGDSLLLALAAAAKARLRDETPGLRGGLPPHTLRRVTSYLMDNIHSEVRVETLAEMAGLSSAYFSRAFRDSTGLPPHRWMMKARVDKASALLLADRTRAIADIALEVGFCDQAHFTRVFNAHVGAPPRAWRRANA
jgi:AraC family transcriptional regulator